ncbi:arsenate reductase/protein-tyrosine-phosphatase family protein [Halalkalicoccus jeotgali]|uniref:Low molecular weight protein-tyrosine-phosphatase n=1 Tax=Halalkalicoccus jeotgali (strain DSM 18796 / CECT 7217 / JCM 14584 / KCTC 4019 / B3) TaxID=795797 RepID=D8J477_HALJB|nr:protein-tyrosine-phosphatase [Halalkalicoccus jeotgali]ADJ15469.1 low molecular weight protein-tyrosine-phosphatase [Halalkalicoccus jeotgali B3]ELY36122.1 low molecular weight protein-tyrosine-phosphatase [Halalkalicoccus jeotgali B3]
MIRSYIRQGRTRLGIERRRLAFRTGSESRPVDPARIRRALDPDSHLLFCCTGNICRSPLAERYLRERADSGGLTADSAGLLDRAGRPSPDLAVAAAAEYGVDLSEHRSRPVSRERIDSSDLVFVMDARNYHAFAGRFEDALSKTYLLKPVLERDDEHGDVEIEDPHRTDAETFRRVFGEVVDAVEELLRVAGS